MTDIADIATVPNQIPWYYLTLVFLLGASALAHGNIMVFRGWEKELNLPRWFSIVGDVFGIVLAVCLGCFVGYLIWNWALGGSVSLVGAFSSTLIVSLVRARFGAAKEALVDVTKQDKQ